MVWILNRLWGAVQKDGGDGGRGSRREVPARRITSVMLGRDDVFPPKSTKN